LSDFQVILPRPGGRQARPYTPWLACCLEVMFILERAGRSFVAIFLLLALSFGQLLRFPKSAFPRFFNPPLLRNQIGSCLILSKSRVIFTIHNTINFAKVPL